MANHTSSVGRLVTLAVALGAAGGAAADFKPLEGQQYREFFDPPNPVKGEALVGVSIVPSQKAQEGDEVQVWFSGRYAGKLIVETLAADGSFRGIGSFEGSSEDEWTALLIRPDTKTPGKTRPADPETLALAVRGEGPDEFVIAHWGDKPKAQDALVVRFYVNGRRGDMTVNAGDATVRCKPVDLPCPLRFDATCDLPFAAVLATYSIVLTRSDGFGSDLNDEDIATLSSLTTEGHIMLAPNRPPIVGKAANDEVTDRAFEQFDFDEIWTPVETVVSGEWRMIHNMFNSNRPPPA